MIEFDHRPSYARIVAVAAFAGALTAACTAFQSSPKQVRATNPTVTYKYRSDDELVRANQLAATFCEQYRNAPEPVRFSSDSDGDHIVVFECVASPRYGVAYPNSNLTYTYRTDHDLVDASRQAQAYCSNLGSSQVASNIVSDGNGTKTVTFQCRQT